MSAEDFIVDEEVVVSVTHRGYIKRTPTSVYRQQHRGGKPRPGGRHGSR
jgi:DNA gyrase subunit A